MTFIANITALIALIVLAIAIVTMFSIYIRSRNLSDRLAALACKEFHSIAASLMETSAELPDSVLDHIAFLNSQALARETPWKFYFSLRKFNSGATHKGRSQAKISLFEKEFEGMRPELKSLTKDLTTMWLHWIMNRNLFWGALIAFEIKKQKAKNGDLSHTTASVGSSIFPSFEFDYC